MSAMRDFEPIARPDPAWGQRWPLRTFGATASSEVFPERVPFRPGEVDDASEAFHG